MRGEIHLTYWVLHSNVLYCQVCASTIFLESKMALLHYIFLAAEAPFATCKVSTVQLYRHISFQCDGRQSKREGRDTKEMWWIVFFCWMYNVVWTWQKLGQVIPRLLYHEYFIHFGHLLFAFWSHRFILRTGQVNSFVHWQG